MKSVVLRYSKIVQLIISQYIVFTSPLHEYKEINSIKPYYTLDMYIIQIIDNCIQGLMNCGEFLFIVDYEVYIFIF